MTAGPEPNSGPRLSVRRPISADGFVDGGWWPRTRDLSAEIPMLIEVLAGQHRSMTHVAYHLDAWDPAPAQLWVGKHAIHLDGFHHHDPLLLTLLDAAGADRMDLLVIPPETSPAVAERALAYASAEDDLDRPEELLKRALSG